MTKRCEEYVVCSGRTFLMCLELNFLFYALKLGEVSLYHLLGKLCPCCVSSHNDFEGMQNWLVLAYLFDRQVLSVGCKVVA